MGRGVEALKAKADTAIADIPLSENKALHTACAFLSTDPKDFTDEDICRTVEAPVSYTHLDVYKRQASYTFPPFSFAQKHKNTCFHHTL